MLVVTPLLFGIVVSCNEPATTLVPDPTVEDSAAEEGRATLLWAREVHNFDGFGQGIEVQPVRGGEAVAVLHNGDSLNRLFHLDTADGHVIDSFLVDAPGFGTGRIGWDIGGCRRLGDDYIAIIDRWPFRIDVTSGAIQWLRRGSLDNGYLTADSDSYFGATLTDWDEVPSVYELNAITGTPVDSLVFADYPADRRGGVRGIAVGSLPDSLGGGHVVYFANGYITRDSLGYARSWLQAVRWDDKRVLWRRRFVEDQSANGRTPILYDSLLIRPGWDTIHAFNRHTGEEVWSYFAWRGLDQDIGGRHFLDANPVLSRDGLVYFGASSADEPIFCLDAATGRRVWQVDGFDSPGAGSAFQLLGDGMLAVSAVSGNATYLYDRHTGRELAQLDKISTNGWIYAGVHYDSATRRVYGYDGARAYCYRLNFEPPGE